LGVLLISFTLYLLFLIIENILYSKKIESIPMRITVSGTRGKTSIVRTLASVLRSSGMQVLAKTTGSQARYIFPDGTEKSINRKGIISVLEQKGLINKGLKLKADCIISEVMSIQAENHQVETNKLIKPHITILSNFRKDHIDSFGKNNESITRLFTNDLYPGSTVIIHTEDINEIILKDINIKNCNLHEVSPNNELIKKYKKTGELNHLKQNLNLINETAKLLRIDENVIYDGIKNTKFDIGKLEIYVYKSDNKEIYFVNSFAANDPESTIQLIAITKQNIKCQINNISGILSLRSDRGERSQQWLEYLIDKPNIFDRIYCTGIHSGVFKRKVSTISMSDKMSPEEITKSILDKSENGTVIFGLANIVGIGSSLIQYWEQTAKKYL